MRSAYIICGPDDVLLENAGTFSKWEYINAERDRIWSTRSLVRARRLAASWRRADIVVCVGWFVSADEIVAPDVVQQDLLLSA